MKKDTIDARIAALESELEGLRRKKLAALQEQLSQLQTSLSGGGRAPRAKSEGGAKVGRKAGGGRGKRISEEEVVERLRKSVAASGSEGISARAAAIESGVFYLRAIKAMPEHFVKHGSGKWTRYTIS